MEQREKLIELITNFYDGDSVCDTCENDKSYGRCNKCISTHEADHLLANGVVVLPCRCGECEHHDDCICVVCEDGETVVCSLQHGHVDKNGFCNKAKRKGGGE